MKTLIATLALLLMAQSAFATKSADSYYVKNFKGGDVDPANCELLPIPPDDGVYVDANCFLGDPASYYGYQLKIIAGDHSMIPLILFNSKEVPYNVTYADHSPGSGASQFYGLTNGIAEVRFYNDKDAYEMTRVPFAMIVRMDTARAIIDKDGNVRFEGYDQELLVFSLAGEDSKLIGKINARQEGANKKARALADTLLK